MNPELKDATENLEKVLQTWWGPKGAYHNSETATMTRGCGKSNIMTVGIATTYSIEKQSYQLLKELKML